ncbi:hypothetical protein EGT07_21750 [Herbaspirillum sp. HC18]|nr:hypothetical protein EGT07_21750 [Herbaspirillum sp. HC18]
MTNISHFRFQSDDRTRSFQPLSVEEYQAARTHPEQPVKDRSNLEAPAAVLSASRVRALSVYRARDENLRRSLMHFLGPRRYLLQPGDTVKMIGYNADESPVATTGTSRIDMPCLTDGMGPCIAVAIGGERRNNGSCLPGAKARIFHVFPFNTNSVQELSSYITKLQDAGLTVRAAMHGGEEMIRLSRKQAANLRAMFAEANVHVDFDETCENLVGSTLLGAVIREDNSVQFVTELVQPVKAAP